MVFDVRDRVSGTEWLLLVIVIVVPLILAIIVTKWTLDQALKRQRKNRQPHSAGERIQTPLAVDPPEEKLPAAD